MPGESPGGTSLASAARRPPWRPPPRAADLPFDLALGACVQLSLAGSGRRSQMNEEGLVIEVVPPGLFPARSRIVSLDASTLCQVVRYLVQTDCGRVLRRASGLLVIAP